MLTKQDNKGPRGTQQEKEVFWPLTWDHTREPGSGEALHWGWHPPGPSHAGAVLSLGRCCWAWEYGPGEQSPHGSSTEVQHVVIWPRPRNDGNGDFGISHFLCQFVGLVPLWVLKPFWFAKSGSLDEERAKEKETDYSKGIDLLPLKCFPAFI